MTQLLEKMLIEVYKLSPERQDAIALMILEELEDERRWDKTLHTPCIFADTVL